MSLREWPVRRVVGVSVAWVIVACALLAGWTFYGMSVQAQQGNGVGAVSFGIAEFLVLVMAPPILLVVLWHWLRRPSVG